MKRSPVIRLENVGCYYRTRQRMFLFTTHMALKNVSFTLRCGEALGVIGRNGAGKSTLLRLLAGILLPDDGQVITHGSPKISLLSLQLGFANELSGRDNAILGAMLLGYSKKEVLNRLSQIVAFAELEQWIDQPLKTYSSGMRARLGFAVANQMRPDVLLVDEVLGVGDVAFRQKSMQAMLEKFNTDQTIVFVSHQASMVKKLCQRAVWIEDGVSRMVGEVNEVVDAYEEYLVGR